jgi:ribosomal protein S12 methylthiotransferase accessory factor
VILLGTPFTPLADALGRLEDAVSPLVGIVTHSVGTMSAPDESPLPNCACELASATRTLGAFAVEYGSGAHPDPARARAAAIGEAVERYSATFVPSERLRTTTARKLGVRAVRPSRFGLFDASQLERPEFPFVPFDEDTTTAFVEGYSLTDGGSAWLPAELVYLQPPVPGMRPIGYATSSGLACGPSYDEAVLAALLELVERDAVMLTWSNRLSLPLLRWDGDDDLEVLDDRYFGATGLPHAVVDASAFLDVPVAIGIVHGMAGSRAALAVGAGCAASMRDAWLKALSEAFGVHRWLGLQIETDPERPVPRAEDVSTFDDHMLFYSSAEHAERAAFLLGSRDCTFVADVPMLQGATPRELIAEVVGRLARHGVAAYAVDVTSPDVRCLGLHVVRVVCPELCALDVAHTARFLGSARLLTGAYAAEVLPGPLDVGALNPDPHPFP